MTNDKKTMLTILVLIVIGLVGMAVEGLRLRFNGWFALITVFVILLVMGMLIHGAGARDDGRYAASPLKPWFDSLASKKGPCCSDADGSAVSDADWDTKDGHYRVKIEGEWHDVPDDALITQPNLYGKTMVWPITGTGGLTIRCFMPGVMG